MSKNGLSAACDQPLLDVLIKENDTTALRILVTKMLYSDGMTYADVRCEFLKCSEMSELEFDEFMTFLNIS